MMWSSNRTSIEGLGLKKAKSISLKWAYKEDATSGFVIDTDGNLISKTVGSSLDVTIVARKNVPPSMTTAQRETLRSVIKYLSSGAGTLSITSGNGELQDTALAMYRNTLG